MRRKTTDERWTILTQTEQHDKNTVTLVSVSAAVLLTTLKLVVGVLTGSLGLLSDAAHSGLDLVASLITLASVRIAGRPADEDHPYGHQRVENLSATLQGFLLLVTAAAIIYGAIRRLVFKTVEVDASGWAFAVMGASILIDLWRSRMLMRAAKRFHSKAIEADALNFRADLLSSTVVIVGLALVAYAETTGRATFLLKSDAVAALVVGGMIVYMSGRLALQGVGVLLDQAPTSLRGRLTEAAASVAGVVESQPVRLRESGSLLLADVTVSVPRTTSLAEAHLVTERVEEALRKVEPRTETLVHVEPTIPETETAAEAIRAVALRMGIRTHHEQVSVVGDHLEATLHVEVEPERTLGEAHALAHRLVDALKADNPRLRRVDTHLEVTQPRPDQRREASRENPSLVERVIQAVHASGVRARSPEVRLYRTRTGSWDMVLHCVFPASLPMGEIHRRTEHLEQELRQHFPELEQVVIHAEPGN